MPSDRYILSRESNKNAPLPDFHGNWCSQFDSERRFTFTPSAICHSDMKVCPGFSPPFPSGTSTNTKPRKNPFIQSVNGAKICLFKYV